MTVTAVDQLTAGGTYPHEDCGEACVASILIDFWLADTVAAIEHFDMLAGDNPADGTGGDVHVARLRAVGIPAHVASGDWTQLHASLTAQGLDRCMVAVWSNAAGVPWPGSTIGHWLLWAGGDTYMNPVGGVITTWSVATVAAAQQAYQVVVDEAAPPDRPVWHPGGPMDQDVVESIVKLTYVVASLAKTAEGQGPFNTDSLAQDAVDPSGFATNVQAVMTGKNSLRTTVNYMLAAIAGKG